MLFLVCSIEYVPIRSSPMRLSLYEFETGVETIGGNRVVYDVTADEARFGAASVDGHALVWQLDHDESEASGAFLSRPVHLDPFSEWIVRCDRVDFPRGSVAHTHTHPGPGIRYLLRGEIEIRTEGRSSFYGPGGAWFESGPDPVHATASRHAETGFVRVLLLPAEWAAKRTIRYVDPADDDLPKLQRATVLLEHTISLPA
jgi:quercetin dioxygenase-like cupin family protein